ncbi:MAG TPA: STAS domain-containing protein [Pilimelia sp.]|nr:STAS domain-containing protein [Pilimelia sp.]
MPPSSDAALRVVASDPPAATGATVVTMTGNLDIDSAPTLRRALDELLGRSVVRVVVDLSELGFCDSIGLSALVDAHRVCTRAGGYFRLAGPTPVLRRVLGVVGLAGRLPIFDSVPAALAARDGEAGA